MVLENSSVKTHIYLKVSNVYNCIIIAVYIVMKAYWLFVAFN